MPARSFPRATSEFGTPFVVHELHVDVIQADLDDLELPDPGHAVIEAFHVDSVHPASIGPDEGVKHPSEDAREEAGETPPARARYSVRGRRRQVSDPVADQDMNSSSAG